MKLTSIAANQTQLITDQYIILFSYQTPVAVVERETGKRFKTDKKWSATTSRHITQWFDGCRNVETRPQEFFDNLVK